MCSAALVVQIINIKEMRRRLSEAELENLPLPELSQPSDILQDFHLRTVSQCLVSVCTSVCLSQYVLSYFTFILFLCYVCLQCFDAVGWAAGRASEWLGAGVVVCL